jgi:ubiquinone/menaquinone biosynthesis C-methylase UbiE
MSSDASAQDVTEANRSYYNLVAEKYLQNERYAYTEQITADVVRLLSLGASNSEGRSRFLDLGCGSGFLSSLVSKLQLFDEGIGIDVSERQLEIYNSRMQGRPFVGMLGDARDLHFPDQSFDMVAGYSVLHHFHDYNAVLIECFRILKSGGCIYFDFEPNRRFKQSFKHLISLRRKLFDRSPTALEQVERLAEYHNNYLPGICRDSLLSGFADRYSVIETGWRFPGTPSGIALKMLSRISSSFSPLFYVLIKKKA